MSNFETLTIIISGFAFLIAVGSFKENMPDKAILEIDTTLRKEKYKVLLK